MEIASSTGLVSILAETVSIVAVLRGAKKLRVATTLLGVSLVVDAAVVITFFDVRAASFMVCHFRLLTSLKPSP
jgi:hypothetical protein